VQHDEQRTSTEKTSRLREDEKMRDAPLDGSRSLSAHNLFQIRISHVGIGIQNLLSETAQRKRSPDDSGPDVARCMCLFSSHSLLLVRKRRFAQQLKGLWKNGVLG
jgi:hypothetical protein